jgi:hypothetical protein
MSEEKDTWSEYSKLVLKELERLNDNHEKMRSDFDSRLNEMNTKLGDIKNIEKNVGTNTAWIDRVNDVWSPSQMQSAKDEIYKQKGKWTATIAIVTFIQILMGIGITLFIKFIS